MTTMDTRMRAPRMCATLALLAVATCSAAGCGGSTPTSSGSVGNSPVTLTFWHNAAEEPGRGVWQSVADAYHQAHPNVTFKVSPTQNETLKTKIPIALQSADPPRIFQQWGGGAQATQVQSGKLMDMTAATASWIKELGNSAALWQSNGKQYGVPYDLHVVGFWYRKDLFATAGITAPPTTMDEFNADVQKLRAAKITPIAIGSKDKWPD